MRLLLVWAVVVSIALASGWYALRRVLNRAGKQIAIAGECSS
jgi:hypothetical protein